MARKKSRFPFFVWMLLTALSGGGVGGYLKPDLPVVGPIVKSLFAGSTAGEKIGAGDLLNATQIRSGQAPAQLASSRRPSDSLLIASFNIQVLGKSKMSKPGVVEVLAQVIRQFDIVAIQEVRAKEDGPAAARGSWQVRTRGSLRGVVARGR